MVAVLASKFHVSPYQMAQELDNDPEQLAIHCLSLVNYSDIKNQFDQAKGKEEPLEHLAKSETLLDVRRNTMDLMQERVKLMREGKGPGIKLR